MSETKEDSEKENTKIKPKRIHIVDRYYSLGASDKEHPCTLEELNLDLNLYQSKINYLIKNGIIICINEDKKVKEKKKLYYFDFGTYPQFKTNEDKRFFMLLASIIIPGIIFLLLGVAWIFSAF